MLVDKTLVLRKIAELERYEEQVREFAGISLSAYRADWKTQRIVERTLQMMIEACVDIAGHMISDLRMRTPSSYADTFRVLGEHSVLDHELLGNMEKMAKFRNVVVHQYEAVDPEIVIAILRKHIDDFRSFRDAIVACLRTT